MIFAVSKHDLILEMIPIDDKISTSNFFYSIRGLAIISVAYAHSLSLSNETMQRTGLTIGVMGVPLFLLCSGIYFKQQNWDILSKKLIANVVVPWLIWGLFNFCISLSLAKIDYSVHSLLAYIFGYGTWLYYIPVYLILRILYDKFNSNAFLLTSIVISVVMNTVTCIYSADYLFRICEPRWITPYQNPLNWAGFFALGIICSRIDFLSKLCKMSLLKKFLSIALFSVLAIFAIVIKLDINYWNPWCILLEYSALVVILVLGLIFKTAKSKILIITGKNSYLIYLLHMQLGIAIANRIYKLINAPDIVLLLAKPLTVIIITLFVIFILKWILTLMGLKSFEKYLGIYSSN